MEFTTEKRRELTAGVIQQEDTVNSTEKFSDNINAAIAYKINEDKSNREMFLTINSELTGLAYEYKYITGKEHALLEETKFTYIDKDPDTDEYKEYTYWDSELLHKAAALQEETEFFDVLSEETSDFYPRHPERFSKWFNDDEEEFVSQSPITEQEMFNTIKNIISWYNGGGITGTTQELTIYGEFKAYAEGEKRQQYMTVGFSEYVSGMPTYMSDGYNPVGDIIYINKGDEENYCLAKIVDAKRQPSRILVKPFFIKGTIPENAKITSVHTQGDTKYIEMAQNTILELKKIYNMILHYLNNNPNKNLESNAITYSNIQNAIELIDNFINSEGFSNPGFIIDFVNNLSDLRTPTFESRAQFIRVYLSGKEDLYEDRFKIIDVRLSKRMGTLREVMKAKVNISELFRITNEKKEQVNWFKKYFIVKKCERDGDWKRRVFVVDNNNEFQVGDTVYLLTDNKDVPEIKATIDIIVNARLDEVNVEKINANGVPETKYYPVKKIFFKDAWKNGEVKLKRFFSDEYKTSEGFRIIKQITD